MIKRKVITGIVLVLVMLFPLAAEYRISVRVEPGEHWHSRMWVIVFPVTKSPQLAVWVETPEGEYVDTLTVTGRTAEQKWRSAPEGGRPESLPVWSHASAAGNDDLDAASTATPDDRVQLERGLSRLEPDKRYVIRAEVNHSYDYNEHWPKKAREGDPGYSGVNGQPSVLYEGNMVYAPGNNVVLEPVGRGSVDGLDGIPRKSLTGLTTALSIVETIAVTIDSE